MVTFFEKLNHAVRQTGSLLCVGLDPDPQRVPERFHSAADPLLAWNQAIIEATAPFACAYKPNYAFYQALGRAGYDLLHATRAAVPPEIPVILDVKYGDIGSTAEAYAANAFDVWGADAVTANPYLGRDSLEPFLSRPDKAVFVLCRTSNPGAADLQSLPVGGQPLYEVVAQRVLSWDRLGNIGLVVGATAPRELADVRVFAPDTWILAPGVGAQGGDLQATLAAGLTGQGDGLLITVSRGIAQASDMRAYTRDLVASITAGRQENRQPATSRHGAEMLALALHETGCVQFGDFTLHSGKHSPIYIDLRLLVSQPAVLRLAADAYSRLLQPLSFARLAPIPYAALPIGTAVSLDLGVPMIYPRKEAKAYGTAKAIEGHFMPGEQVAILDDLITNGESKLEAIAPLEAAGLNVRDIVVLIDREQGGREQLAARGYRTHAVLCLSELLGILVRAGRISHEEEARVLQALNIQPKEEPSYA